MTDHESGVERREREVREYAVIGLPQPELDDLAVLATQLCRVPAAAINLMESGTQATVAAVGVERGICALTDSMCNAILEEDHPVQVADASSDPRWADNPYVNGELERFRYYSAHHLVTPRGVTVGTMCVFDHEPRDPDPAADLQLAQLSHRVMDFLELRLRTRQLEVSVIDLTQAHAELARSNEMLRLFAAQVAHDLRGPITAVDVSLQMLRDDHPGVDAPVDRTSGQEPASWLVDRALGSVRRMNELIRDVLAFASVGGSPHVEDLDLAALVTQLRDDLAAELDGVELLAEGLPVVAGDHTQWRVVLQNLISNSVKFNDRDDAWVRVHAVREPGRWLLEVSDNGPGVPPGDRERIFGLLTQGDPHGDGIGLGLATCWRIVEAHEGHIEMDQAPAGGALVRITVPDRTELVASDVARDPR